MTSLFRDLRVSRKLAVLAAVGVLGLAVFATVALRTMSEVRVGGEDYSEIIENNVLLADVLPPPAYLVETHLVAHEALLAQLNGDDDGVEQRIEHLERLEQDYLDRQAYWTDSTLVPESTRELILETSATPALAYFELADGPFAEALRSGDTTATQQVLSGPMTAAYDEHRAGVDQIVETTVSEATRIEGETIAAAERGSTMLLVLLVVTLLAVVLAGWAVARTISAPLASLRRRLSEVAAGDADLTTRLDTGRGDEFGDVAGSFNTFVGRMAGTVEQIRDNGRELEDEARELRAASDSSAEVARASERQIGELASASTRVADSITQVVDAAGQMQAAIDEIGRSVGRSVDVAHDAVGRAQHADEIIGVLDENSGEISAVVEVITQIAGQTNLLALNATIEAARAGEAGAGFAVVANEVKELATATATATGDITERITAMQGASRDATAALVQIREIIDQISEMQTMIAAAVEEQTATTRGIQESVRSAAVVTEEISSGLDDTASAATASAAAADSTSTSAGRVAATAADLRRLVGQFRTSTDGSGRAAAGAPVETPTADHAPVAPTRTLTGTAAR